MKGYWPWPCWRFSFRGRFVKITVREARAAISLSQQKLDGYGTSYTCSTNYQKHWNIIRLNSHRFRSDEERSYSAVNPHASGNEGIHWEGILPSLLYFFLLLVAWTHGDLLDQSVFSHRAHSLRANWSRNVWWASTLRKRNFSCFEIDLRPSFDDRVFQNKTYQ